jgi:hypothetical protein
LKIIHTIDRYLLSLHSPQEFNSGDPDNVLKAIDESFQNVCAALQEAGIADPKTLSTYEFHHRVEFFSKRAKPKQ